ncbi:type III restriction-modification system endonuclease [Mammaliicoccus sciuri]|uniref:type III restriction-modification system endonuclease n=1 Tax=Mammaliicoccus sciuri TaxID=1296 RepID=UPI0021D07EE4|nr:type III restriction-modification system endonuclease [Mammaliicoccus sciuri]UXU79296.1 type III restriction-modification system endonuclease [Mammaliicoccus sciuri]
MIKLTQLDYQIESINSVVNVFKGVPLKRCENTSNPVFNLKDKFVERRFKENISGIQKDNKIIDDNSTTTFEDYLEIDVKMETGTGKTYVYSRLMMELKKAYGFNKFIIIVPTTPIKEGVKSFIESDAFEEHYKSLNGMENYKIDFASLESQKYSKSNRKYPPVEVNSFSDGSAFAKNTIYGLLMGMGMLKTGKYSTLDRDDYDQLMLGDTHRPVEALSNTNPIVIIDEPHKFSKNNKTFKYIEDNLNPLAIIRFGATFPSHDGKRDYKNLVYDLSSAEAFNKDLVKGVSLFNPVEEEWDNLKFTLMKIDKKNKLVKFRNENNKQLTELNISDSLSKLDSRFSGIQVLEINKVDSEHCIKLSNDKLLFLKDTIIPGVFSESYQELMLKKALDLHFDTEMKYFLNADPRYKALSLFFIDSVNSYRLENGTDGYLRLKFQSLLKDKMKNIIKDFENKSEITARELEYIDFLNASLNDIRETNGGYFSKDNDTNDESIKKEVNKILRDKESLLSFKDKNQKWNTKRFIFSKWTLREGWDNPNIFTIAKLRSSGSDNSKIQEIGRGLRLPVDEFGQRAEPGKETFYLNYLVDQSENGFVEEIFEEINQENTHYKNIRSLIESVAKKLNISIGILAGKLMLEGYIDEDYNIYPSKRKELYEKYPDFNVGVKDNKIVSGKAKSIKIRQKNFDKIKDVWFEINNNFMIDLNEIENDILFKGIEGSIDKSMFQEKTTHFQNKKLIFENGEGKIESSIVDSSYHYENKMPYGEFLKECSIMTNLHIALIHKAICNYYKNNNIEQMVFSNSSVNIFVQNFNEWFIRYFEDKYSFRKLVKKDKKTSLTDENGIIINEINQNDIGTKIDSLRPPEQYLYELTTYDSDLERDNIVYSTSKDISAYAKLPRRSIRVPLYFGGTTSPDFIYMLEAEGSKTNIVIESKDVENSSSIRDIEKKKITASKKYFNLFSDDNEMHFSEQYNTLDINTILKNLQNSKKRD